MFLEDENCVLDSGLEYRAISGLSKEVMERLEVVRPTSMVSVCVFDYFILIQSNFSILVGCGEEDGRYDARVSAAPASVREKEARTGTWGSVSGTSC